MNGRQMAALASALAFASGPAMGSVAPPMTLPASLVDPFVGTDAGAGTFPGAALPFGMVQASPNTKQPAGGGYNWAAPVTWGFGTTHLSGPGCPAMGDVTLMPTAGPVSSSDPHAVEQPFSHSAERASPGWYAVRLRSGASAELTATTRT